MFRDVANSNTYNYGDSLYWDSRYIQEDGSFDWYQDYSALRPFIRKYVATSSHVLMVGCGNSAFVEFPCFALMNYLYRELKSWREKIISEDMVNDGYEDIVNIDISSVAIDLMRAKYESIPQLKYLQMDVRDMSFFPDDTFDSIIDKGTLDSLLCGNTAPLSSSQMLGEVCRLLKPGGIYMLVTYGDPTVRMPHLMRPVYNWTITLYIIPRPGFESKTGAASLNKSLEPVPTTDKGLLLPDFVMEDPDSHFIYVCTKMDEMAELVDHCASLTVES